MHIYMFMPVYVHTFTCTSAVVCGVCRPARLPTLTSTGLPPRSSLALLLECRRRMTRSDQMLFSQIYLLCSHFYDKDLNIQRIYASPASLHLDLSFVEVSILSRVESVSTAFLFIDQWSHVSFCTTYQVCRSTSLSNQPRPICLLPKHGCHVLFSASCSGLDILLLLVMSACVGLLAWCVSWYVACVCFSTGSCPVIYHSSY